MTFKKTIIAAALALSSFGAFATEAPEVRSPIVDKEETVFDYSFFNASINHSTKTDLSFVELEGGFGKGSAHFYGFVDIDEEGDVFTKLNPTVHLNDNVFLSYTFKTFNADDSYHAAGVGYKWFDTDGHIAVSLNAVTVGDGDFMTSDDVGVGLHTNFKYALSADQSWSVGGWVDIDTVDDTRFIPEFGAMPSTSVFHGNVGVTKAFSNGLYGRVAYDFTQVNLEATDTVSGSVGSDGIQFTAGYSF